MSDINYKKPILISLATLACLILFSTVVGNETGYTQLLPDSMGFQIGYLFWMSMIATLIGCVFIGYVLAPLFLVAHKYTIGIRMQYGIQERPQPTKLKIVYKTIFPALMAINLALMFSNLEWVQNLVINPEWLNNSSVNTEAQKPLVVLATILPLMCGISMGIFSPIWFLLDAGIVFTNKEKVKGLRDPIEVRSVGGWYHYILKGYAGIAIIVTYFFFASDMLTTTQFNPGLLLVPILPLLIIVMSIPAFVIMDITAEHRKKFMLTIARKVGITESLEDPLDLGKKV